MTTIYLVRHGQTDWNAEKRWQGHTDIPLNQIGREQAHTTASLLKEISFDTIYCSDLSRARETAEVITQQYALPLIQDERLREMFFGDLEGLTWAEIKKNNLKGAINWITSNFEGRPPNGESLSEFHERLTAFWHDLPDNSEQTILLVAHGGSIRMLLTIALGLPKEAQWQFKVDNCTVTKLMKFDVGGRLDKLNERG